MAGVNLVVGWNYVSYLGDTLPCSQAIPQTVIDNMATSSRGVWFWNELTQTWNAWGVDIPSAWEQELMMLVNGETYSLQMAAPVRWEFIGGAREGFPWAKVGVGIGIASLIGVAMMAKGRGRKR